MPFSREESPYMPTYPKRHTYPGIHLLTRGMLEVKIPVLCTECSITYLLADIGLGPD